MRHLSLLTRAAVGIAALVSVLMLMTGSALAAGSCSGDMWTGGAGDDLWSSAGNWSEGVPGNQQQTPGEVDVCIPTGSSTVILAYETTVNSITVGSGDTLDIWGEAGYTHGLLILNNQDAGLGVQSGATVSMGYHGQPTDSAYETHGGFSVLSGTLDNAGTIISADTGDETPNIIHGVFDNSGTLTVNNALVNAPDGSNDASGSWTNTGTISIASGQTVEIGGGGSGFSFSEPSGTLADNGTFKDDGGAAFDITGSGTTSGNQLQVAANDIQLSSSGSGSVDDNTGGGTLTGTITSGWTLQINGNAAYNQGAAATNGNVVNNGTMLLGSNNGTYGVINATSGGFTNNGTITTQDAPGSAINGTFVNNGTLNANDGLGGTPSAWTLGGTVNIPSGQQVALGQPGSNAGTVTFTGTINDTGGFTINNNTNVVASSGTISGNPVILGNGVLEANGTGSGEFHIENGGGQIGSDIAQGYTVWASGNPGYSHGNLTPTGSYTNNGTLEFGSTDGTHGTLTVPAGDTLTNDGTLIFEATNNGPDSLSGALVNNGTLTADNNFSGTGAITNNGLLELTAASAQNSETSYTQGASGTLKLDVTGGGTPVVPGFTLTGAATVAGKLAVATSGGTAKGTFPAITAASGKGTFTASYTGGEFYSLTYKAGSVSLTGPAAAPVTAAPKPTISSVTAGAGLIKVKLKCVGKVKCAGYTIIGTVKVVEKVKGKKKTVTDTIIKTTGAVAAGKTATVSIAVNALGKSLLKQGSLKASVTITVAGKKVKVLTVKLVKTVMVKTKK